MLSNENEDENIRNCVPVLWYSCYQHALISRLCWSQFRLESGIIHSDPDGRKGSCYNTVENLKLKRPISSLSSAKNRDQLDEYVSISFGTTAYSTNGPTFQKNVSIFWETMPIRPVTCLTVSRQAQPFKGTVKRQLVSLSSLDRVLQILSQCPLYHRAADGGEFH